MVHPAPVNLEELSESRTNPLPTKDAGSRAELYVLAVLIGQGMAVVYVLGTLVINCLRT